jgi:hypothetical protein
MSTNQLGIVWHNENGVINTLQGIVGGGGWQTTNETSIQATLLVATTYSYYTTTMSDATAVFRKNGSNGNQTTTNSNFGSYIMNTDTTHSDSATANDLVNGKCTIAGAAPILQQGVQMNTVSPCAHQGSGGPGNNGLTISTLVQFVPIQGGTGGTNGNSTSTYGTQTLVTLGGSASYMSVSIDTSSAGTATTTFNKNGSAGNQTLSISSGTTGIFTDTTHSDSLAASNLVDFRYISLAASGTIWSIYYFFTPAASSGQDLTSSLTGHQLSTSATGGWGGPLRIGGGATLLTSQGYVSYAATAYKARLTSDASSGGNTGLVTLQIQGLNGNNVASFSLGVAGSAIDLTHSDSLTPGQLINASYTASPGSISFSSGGITLDDGSYVIPAHPTSFAAVYG